MTTRQQQIENLKKVRDYEYSFYRLMISKCYNTRHHHYSKFGLKGFTVHTDWRLNDDRGFIQFLLDIGKRPSSRHTLELLGMFTDFNPNTLKWIHTKQGVDSHIISDFVDSKTKWSGFATSRDERFFI